MNNHTFHFNSRIFNLRRIFCHPDSRRFQLEKEKNEIVDEDYDKFKNLFFSRSRSADVNLAFPPRYLMPFFGPSPLYILACTSGQVQDPWHAADASLSPPDAAAASIEKRKYNCRKRRKGKDSCSQYANLQASAIVYANGLFCNLFV